jgi:hypothetical protein
MNDREVGVRADSDYFLHRTGPLQSAGLGAGGFPFCVGGRHRLLQDQVEVVSVRIGFGCRGCCTLLLYTTAVRAERSVEVWVMHCYMSPRRVCRCGG